MGMGHRDLPVRRSGVSAWIHTASIAGTSVSAAYRAACAQGVLRLPCQRRGKLVTGFQKVGGTGGEHGLFCRKIGRAAAQPYH